MLKFFKNRKNKDLIEKDDAGDIKTSSQPASVLQSGNGVQRDWAMRLKSGLAKSSNKINEGLKDILTRKRLGTHEIEAIEELLIASDMGVTAAASITSELARDKFEKNISPEEVKAYIAEKITSILNPVAKPLLINEQNRPHVLLISGVNGSGKTTTIGKLAKQWQDSGKKVMLAACDTFRAAAIDQLEVWAQRASCTFVKGELHSDAASVAYAAMQQAREQNFDVLIIDTAGRLQNKKNLMEELNKLVRVIKKYDENAPHDNVIVLDATTGQNANNQVKIFKEAVDITGIIITKLDGTAKGGVLVSLAKQFGLSIHAVGVGESAADLRPFAAEEIANKLLGIKDNGSEAK